MFKAGEVERVPVVVAGRGHVADIQGISYPTAAVRENYAQRFGAGAGGVYQIGLLHANVDGSPEHADYAPCSLKELAGAGLDYWALGHVHTRRVLSERPWVVYPGNIQGRSVRETGAKGCYVVEVDGSGSAELRFQALDAVRWLTREVSIADCSTEQELKEALEQTMEEVRAEAEGRPAVLRLVLTGRGRLHGRLQGGYARDLAEELRRIELERWELLEEETGAGEGMPLVWLEKLSVRTGVAADREALLQSEGFLGELLRLAAELESEPQALQEFAGECLEPLLGHHRAGALLRKTGLAGEGIPGAGVEKEFASELLKQASEWLLDHLLDEEEGA